MGNNFFKITESNCNFVVKMIYCGNLHDQAEREKDRKEKLKKFEDWQKVKKEKEEVRKKRRRTMINTRFEIQLYRTPRLKCHSWEKLKSVTVRGVYQTHFCIRRFFLGPK